MADAGATVRSLTGVVMIAVRDQSIEHAPLVIFVLAGDGAGAVHVANLVMPLILAIEPDRRQAAQLSAVVRKRVSAELILVDTTEQALDAIGNRMPDLVLVPALLSPQDDAALAAALRVIAAAAHVQMLTIPVLGGAATGAALGRNALGASARQVGASSSPMGAIRRVFAEQIASYLEHAAQERASAGADDPDAHGRKRPHRLQIASAVLNPSTRSEAVEASAVAEVGRSAQSRSLAGRREFVESAADR